MDTYLISASLSMRDFRRWAGRRQPALIRHGAFDEGFALHILLSELFGKAELQPFRLISPRRSREATLYAYSGTDLKSLQNTARLTGRPDSIVALNPDNMLSKSMPMEFESGQRLGFNLKVRPTRRISKAIPMPDGKRSLAKGSEVDAFLLNAWHRFPDGKSDTEAGAKAVGETREKVYTAWLDERLDGAAVIEKDQCRLVSFQRSRALRGDGRVPEGPDAILDGTLVVGETEKFAARIRGGVGRHKAYGYGMLLLCPPGKHVTR